MLPERIWISNPPTLDSETGCFLADETDQGDDIPYIREPEPCRWEWVWVDDIGCYVSGCERVAMEQDPAVYHYCPNCQGPIVIEESKG